MQVVLAPDTDVAVAFSRMTLKLYVLAAEVQHVAGVSGQIGSQAG